MPCIPIGPGSFMCGGSGMLTGEAKRELELFQRWLVLKRTGATDKDFNVWHQGSEGT